MSDPQATPKDDLTNRARATREVLERVWTAIHGVNRQLQSVCSDESAAEITEAGNLDTELSRCLALAGEIEVKVQATDECVGRG